MGASQKLQQQVCQKYGWSIHYAQEPCPPRWYVDVIVGVGDQRRFVSPNMGENSKDGKETVSALALEGLADALQQEESKPVCELSQAFPNAPLTIYDSHDPSTWKRFWEHPRPTMVGIDTEGNQISPPVLVQIATEDYTILEISKTTSTQISDHLQRLLNDDSIVKVFCDNFSHRDKLSLGLPVSKEESSSSGSSSDSFTKPPIVDLEAMALQLLGPVKVPRGLSKIINLSMAELKVRIEKPKRQKGNIQGRFAKIGRFALIEQGKAKPLKGLSDLSQEEQHYAALDAWCTLQAYKRLKETNGN
jgi:hypothetical protein